MASTQVEIRLLGETPLDACLDLQDYVWRERCAASDPRIDVLLAEHPRALTIGRHGSRGHIQFTDQQLARRQISPRWVSRGGGCVLHAPGQLAVYCIAPLEPLGWTVNDFLWRLQTALVETCDALRIGTRVAPHQFGVWGKSGQLATVGVSVRDWVTRFGLYINVNPPMTDFAAVRTGMGETSALPDRMGCLVSERPQAGRMTQTRSLIVEQLGAAFDCPRYHLHTGHPQLAKICPP